MPFFYFFPVKFLFLIKNDWDIYFKGDLAKRTKKFTNKKTDTKYQIRNICIWQDHKKIKKSWLFVERYTRQNWKHWKLEEVIAKIIDLPLKITKGDQAPRGLVSQEETYFGVVSNQDSTFSLLASIDWGPNFNRDFS